MAIGPDRRYMTRAEVGVAEIDAGLRQYLLRVYNYMVGGLGVTGAVAFLVASTPSLLYAVHGTPLRWLVIFAPLGIAFFFGFRIRSMKASTAQLLFWAFAGLMGLSLSYIFIAYTGASIARVFFITAATFAGVSLYGYTTKRDLSAFGSFLFMGLIGLIIASVANLFLASSALQFAISVIGVLVFTGLTAYDTQRIKETYYEGDTAELGTKKAVFGALALYLDFINLFIMLLQLFGGNRQ